MVQSKPPKVPIHPLEESSENWERVHIYYTDQFQNNFFFLATYTKSKWAEIKTFQGSPLKKKLQSACH